jgi:hypothetical protein
MQGEGVYHLDADVRITCYTPKHWGFLGAGVVWVFLYTVGIPCFFIWLLHHYHVPRLARELSDNAWLRELVKVAWLEGLAQESGVLVNVTTSTIPERNLEAMYAFFILGVSAEDASDILASTQPVLVDNERDADATDAEDQRASLLHLLLKWARHTGAITIPRMHWGDEHKDQGEVDDGADFTTMIRGKIGQLSMQRSLSRSSSKLSELKAKNRRLTRVQSSKKHQEEQEVALTKAGFLFGAYKPEYYFWEVVELLRKLALTSILALISPGTAGQVVVGLLLSFVMLLLTLRCKPYARPLLNNVNALAQLTLFLILLVALLLKVNLDNDSTASFFTGIVSFLTIAPIFIPLAIFVRTFAKANSGSARILFLEHSSWGNAGGHEGHI